LRTVLVHTLLRSTAGQLSIWGTLLAFVPLPLLAFAYTRSMKKAVVWALAILIEPLQLVIDLATGFPSFVVDVDDMMLQVLESAAGIVLTALMVRVASGSKGNGLAPDRG
jgi:hypothetical protein